MTKILIIEDDATIRAELMRLLESAGYQAEALPCLEEQDLSHLSQAILAADPGLILLDINLPKLNGEQLLRALRETSDLPVIMVTSSTSEMDEVLSMSYGADDYITKPYNPQVLLLRIAAVLKRVEAPSNLRNFRELKIDLARGVITVANPDPANGAANPTTKAAQPPKPRRALLTKNEMIIMNHLLEAQGAIVTRDALMTDLWNNQEYINDNALTVNISRLRAKLKSLGADDAIETRKGLGYILN